jgi:purine-binding chemotaxis protein CheW
MSKPGRVLVEQRQALWDYLDALLQEIPEDLPKEAPAAEIQEWDSAMLAAAEPVPVAEVVVEPVPVAPVQVPTPKPIAPAVEIVAPSKPKPVAAPQPAPTVQPELPPAWSKPEFQALLFKVGGLTLAVPLVKLNSVIPWPEEGVTPIPNQPVWCYGLMRHREQNMRVVDTATLVIPEDKREDAEAFEPRHVLIIGDGRWGLACSAIGDVVRLGPQEVKWRSGQGRRPWLAGTVLGHLCALLDTEAFAAMLAAGGRR